jgi:hypothetical protein
MIETTALTPLQLRKFGLTLSLGLIGIFGLIAPLLLHKSLPTWPFLVGSTILIPTFVQPLWLKWVYNPWMKLGAVLGWINTRIILGIIYFVLITPVGIIMRLCGKDTMQKRLDKNATTYRKINTPQSIKHMEKPFS